MKIMTKSRLIAISLVLAFNLIHAFDCFAQEHNSIGTYAECYEGTIVTIEKYYHLFPRFDFKKKRLGGKIKSADYEYYKNKPYKIYQVISSVTYDDVNGWVLCMREINRGDELFCFYSNEGYYDDVPFVIQDDNFECEQFFRSRIKTENDRFSGLTSYNTGVSEMQYSNNVLAMKHVMDNDTIYSITFIINGSHYYTDMDNSCVIVFEDNSRTKYDGTVPEISRRNVTYNPWVYNMTIKLTKTQFETFLSKRITDVRIGGRIACTNIHKANGNYIKQSFKALYNY